MRAISPNSSRADIQKIFEGYGVIKDVYIPLDHFTKRAKGFAFVEFENGEEAAVAQRALDRRVLDGR